MTDLDRMIAWQSDAKAYIDAEQPDRDGAWRGLCDALAEECLLRLEGKRETE